MKQESEKKMYQVQETTARVMDRSTYTFVETPVLVLVDEQGNRDAARWQFAVTETEKAQTMCDEINSEHYQKQQAEANVLFNAIFDAETGKVKKPAEIVEEAPAEEIMIDEQQEVGAIVTVKGVQYRVERSEYISPQEVAELEEGFDIFVDAGWHSWLRKV